MEWTGSLVALTVLLEAYTSGSDDRHKIYVLLDGIAHVLCDHGPPCKIAQYNMHVNLT
jgi:hypothetical protein